MKKFFRIILTFIIIYLTNHSHAFSQNEKIKIGLLAPLSGEYKELGQSIIKSTRMALNDIGTDADTDGFVDGISPAINSTGFKGFFPCNGVLGMSGGATTVSTATADEVEVVVSGDPGASGVTMRLTFLGILGA